MSSVQSGASLAYLTCRVCRCAVALMSKAVARKMCRPCSSRRPKGASEGTQPTLLKPLGLQDNKHAAVHVYRTCSAGQLILVLAAATAIMAALLG
jgi:hypothetical protein